MITKVELRVVNISSQKKVVIVEDDAHIAELLSYQLHQESYHVHHVASGNEALELLEEEHPDIILLDWMLPEISGIELCRRIRRIDKLSNTPIIFLTARTDEDDCIRALETGADDYITKPFSFKVLHARMRAVLKRNSHVQDEGNLEYADITLNTVTYKVIRSGHNIDLGPTEFRLLKHFMKSPQRVFTREQLLDSVWGRDIYVEYRTVDVHIRRLRKALNIAGLPNVIRTVRSTGYSLDQDTPG